MVGSIDSIYIDPLGPPLIFLLFPVAWVNVGEWKDHGLIFLQGEKTTPEKDRILQSSQKRCIEHKIPSI